MENRDTFLEAGGTRYEYIPCLNAETGHLDTLTELVTEELQGWLGPIHDAATTEQLARRLGAEN